MSRAEGLLVAALRALPPKPADSAKSTEKKRYSELMSQVLASAIAEELRNRGLANARPSPRTESGASGAERRMSGGIGAKKVDVTWATEESGLLVGISVKCITARDPKTKNYQKNLINRRGDMLGEAVTLHRRFPYAVLGGFLFLDHGAAADGSDQRSSTFRNAHRALRLFTGRTDPAGRDEQYERFYIILVEASGEVAIRVTHAGEPDTAITIDAAIDALLWPIAERDADFYALLGPAGEIDPSPSASPVTLARVRSGGAVVRAPKKGAWSAVDAVEQEVSDSSRDDDDEPAE